MWGAVELFWKRRVPQWSRRQIGDVESPSRLSRWWQVLQQLGYFDSELNEDSSRIKIDFSFQRKWVSCGTFSAVFRCQIFATHVVSPTGRSEHSGAPLIRKCLAYICWSWPANYRWLGNHLGSLPYFYWAQTITSFKSHGRIWAKPLMFSPTCDLDESLW